MIVDEPRYTLAASGLHAPLGYARARGVDVDAVLAAAGVTPSELADVEARLPAPVFHQVWDALAAGDDAFGLHVAERMDLDAFHVVGHLAMRSPTLGDAFDRIVAYSRLLHDAGRVEVEQVGTAARVYPGCRGLRHPWPRQVAEFASASVVTLSRRVINAAPTVRAVAFRHPRPARISEHLRIFGVEPSFDAPEAFVELDGAVLSRPIVAGEPGLAGFLDAYARELLARLPEQADLVVDVERAIGRALDRGQSPEVGVIAAQLAMSERTLQRRLGERSTKFAEVVDRVRRSWAERYLADDRLAIGEIAFLLGYGDVSNFHRAFRRWTGLTPAGFRDAQRAGAR